MTTQGKVLQCASANFPHPRALIQIPQIENPLKTQARWLRTIWTSYCDKVLSTNYENKAKDLLDKSETCVEYVVDSPNKIPGAICKQRFECQGIHPPPLLL